MKTPTSSPIIKPKTPSGTISIGNKTIDINSGTVPSSPPPESNVIKDKLNQATRNNTFKPIENNESTNQ